MSKGGVSEDDAVRLTTPTHTMPPLNLAGPGRSSASHGLDLLANRKPGRDCRGAATTTGSSSGAAVATTTTGPGRAGGCVGYCGSGCVEPALRALVAKQVAVRPGPTRLAAYTPMDVLVTSGA
jgi:hypothetical protein